MTDASRQARADAIAEEIPGYRIERVLGRGGMATVYLAEQLSLGRQVALKVLDPKLAVDPAFQRRFVREGKIAAGLRHRHIVAIYDVGVHGGAPYMALEYLPLGSIAALAGRMSTAEVLRCIREIAGALDAAHQRGIVHRDVKPENILRHEDGAFLLSDFGVARLASATSVVTQAGAAVGTPAYMSPEQWRDQAIDGRADLYALGIVLYQLTTGELPYQGTDAWAVGLQHLQAPIPQLPPQFKPLQGLLARLLAKDAAERSASGADVARHVEALQASIAAGPAAAIVAAAPGSVSSGGPSAVLLREWPFSVAAQFFESDAKRRSRRRLVIAAWSVVSALIVALALWWWLAGR